MTFWRSIMSQSTHQQIDQAQNFVYAHQGEVTQIEQKILSSGKELLSNLGKKVLAPTDLEKAYSAQAKGDMQRLFSVLRQNASAFVNAKVSKLYWSWIDAAGAFFDATGAHWRYMTQERRAWFLADAKEALSDVRF